MDLDACQDRSSFEMRLQLASNCRNVRGRPWHILPTTIAPVCSKQTLDAGLVRKLLERHRHGRPHPCSVCLRVGVTAWQMRWRGSSGPSNDRNSSPSLGLRCTRRRRTNRNSSLRLSARSGRVCLDNVESRAARRILEAGPSSFRLVMNPWRMLRE